MSATRTPLNPEAALSMAQQAQAMAREGVQAPVRPGARKPFGSMEQNLAWEPIPGYRLYWFNDTPGRIARAKEAGYEHVQDDRGQPVCRNVGRGDANSGGMNGYLMKIPLEWYYDDMGRAQEALDKRLADIKAGRHGATDGQNQYVPKQGIRIDDQR